MVSLGVGEERPGVAESMAMGTERSKPLHNFTLPCLKWGNQRYLRCMKVSSDGRDVSGVDRRSHTSKLGNSSAIRRREREMERRVFARDSDRRLKVPKSRIQMTADESGGDEGIDAVREKLMLDLRTAADKMKDAILRKKAEDEDEEGEEEEEGGVPVEAEELPAGAAAAASAAEVRPWNLRTRRAACKAPIGGGCGGAKPLKIEGKKPNNSNSPMRSDGGAKSPEKKEKTKFAVSLSKREIEEDFRMMLGHKPPRRPKKRPRIVQRQIDTLFPGLWLTEITADTYKVPEFPENGKR